MNLFFGTVALASTIQAAILPIAEHAMITTSLHRRQATASTSLDTLETLGYYSYATDGDGSISCKIEIELRRLILCIAKQIRGLLGV